MLAFAVSLHFHTLSASQIWFSIVDNEQKMIDQCELAPHMHTHTSEDIFGGCTTTTIATTSTHTITAAAPTIAAEPRFQPRLGGSYGLTSIIRFHPEIPSPSDSEPNNNRV